MNCGRSSTGTRGKHKCLSEIWNVNTVWTYRFSRWFSRWFSCFLASVLSCVFTVRYRLSFWSTQFPRKAAFIFKAYQCILSVMHDAMYQDFTDLYFMLSELSRPSLRIHFTFNLMIQEVIQSFCCYQAARRKGKFMTCNKFFAQNMHDQLAGSHLQDGTNCNFDFASSTSNWS